MNKNNIKEGKFESHRLGNVIDMWYFSNFKEFGDKKISDINNFDTRKNDCFSYFLLKNKNIYKKPGDLNLVGYWPIYYYQNIIKCIHNFESNLRSAMEEYDKLNNGILFSQKFKGNKHCVIHYRLGDVVTLGDVIDYKNIIDVIRDLEDEIDTIEIMDGGKNHHPVRLAQGFNTFKKSLLREDVKNSDIIYNNFYSDLIDTFPNMKIIKSEKKSADEDFYRMSSAPILITGAGSYAMASAIAGKSRIIRTPACKNLDHPKEGCIEEIKINKNNCDWKTYNYQML